MNYFSILKNVFIGIALIIIFYFACKLTIFYIPFLIGYIISIIIEPIIKFLNKKTNFTRKTNSIIVLVILFSIIIIGIFFASLKIINEATNMLSGLNDYLSKANNMKENIKNNFNFERYKLSEDVVKIIENSSNDFLNSITNYIKNILNSILEYITSIPKMFVNIIITILATYFICSDKFYILDRMEHHLSKKMVGKLITHVREITSQLGKYIKAELILSGITFIIVLTGLNIFYLIGFNINYPILMAILIGFVDTLPILGAGSIMIPWSAVLFLNQNTSLAFSILGLYVLIVVIKQLIEPKLVSNNIGIHPIFTLLSMYTCFRFIGLIGLLIGPILLIIAKNIFSRILDKGIVNTILDY